MKQVFISQPMNNIPDTTIRENFKKAEEQLTAELGGEFNIINTYIEQEPPTDINAGLWYLGKSLEFLAEADIAVFLNEWETARGCNIEHTCAVAYGIPCIYLEV